MKFQFRTSALLLGTAYLAICFAAILATAKVAKHWYLAESLLYQSPFWLPMVFAAYAVGCRTMTVPFLLAFALVEGVAVGLILWVHHLLG